MKILIGLLLIVLSFCARAELTVMPECIIRGQAVTYDGIDVAANFKFVATANLENGRFIIRYNKNLLSNSPIEWQRQVLLHECGHFKSIFNKSQNYTGQVKEYAADCYSAEVLKNRYNYGSDEFNIIIGAMLTAHVSWDRAIIFEQCALTK